MCNLFGLSEMRNIGSRVYWATIPPSASTSANGERAPPRITEDEAAGRATDRRIFEDAGHLITVWNERQAKRMPMPSLPTIGAAIKAGYWFPCVPTTNRAMSASGSQTVAVMFHAGAASHHAFIRHC